MTSGKRSSTSRAVVANHVIPPEQAITPFAQVRRAVQARSLAEIRDRFEATVLQIPLPAHEIKGLDLLASVGEQPYSEPALAPAALEHALAR